MKLMLVASKYAATWERSLHLFALKDTMTGEKKVEFMIKVCKGWLKQWSVNTLNRLLVLHELNTSVYRFTRSRMLMRHRDYINISWNTIRKV